MPGNQERGGWVCYWSCIQGTRQIWGWLTYRISNPCPALYCGLSICAKSIKVIFKGITLELKMIS